MDQLVRFGRSQATALPRSIRIQGPVTVSVIHKFNHVYRLQAGDQVFSLKTHTKPLKVDVDLVLVPVTITDPLNRLVTGLDKDNFTVFEGKDQQEIKHFSSEDAPVSLGVIFDMSGSMNDKPFNDSGFLADVWVRKNGRWQVVSRRSAPQQQIREVLRSDEENR